jgi:hypothetical protein
MKKTSQIAWKLVPLRHFFPLKVVPLIEALLYLLTSLPPPEAPPAMGTKIRFMLTSLLLLSEITWSWHGKIVLLSDIWAWHDQIGRP